MKTSPTVPSTGPRLVWIQQAPESGGRHVAECGMHTFEICRTHDQHYALQMRQLRPEDWPLVVWEMDGFSLEGAKARAERLADQAVAFILGD